ncbi:DUF3134 domain-containing protein [Microcoleus sp. FACHB-1515]|uniref:DUF3134 domain-containing protein n=1 Tax=Cyanophyceae TaxID=3028117 RepID=UPI0016875F47|nr:DUF3134 domain-containing protein [Microcoleus sp. FACHB-1515]MBD2092488.1 DUF3134 domain-containing protein [Microcoleus sp. FACHB-1515]
MVHNPALRETPRNQPAAVIPLQRDASMLDWLESTGRLLDREVQEVPGLDENEEEISEFLGGDDGGFDVDDDDDDDLDLDD